MKPPELTFEQRERFAQDGFLACPNLMESDVITALLGAVNSIEMFHAVGPLDYAGFTTPGDDLIGRIVRLERLVAIAESLLECECYHYHSKLVRKHAAQPVSLAWHQDYGSWYKDGCLSPNLITCVIALTPATLRNGCFQLLRGSHRLGRLDRLSDGHESYSYFSLSPRRLAAIEQRHECVAMTMNPGDVFFFHANTLHASGSNESCDDRVLLEITYNDVSNSPVFAKQAFHCYTPLAKLSEADFAQSRPELAIDPAYLIDIGDDNDPRVGVFRRRFDIAQC